MVIGFKGYSKYVTNYCSNTDKFGKRISIELDKSYSEIIMKSDHTFCEF